MAFIKNIDPEKVFKFSDEVLVQPNQIVSKTLVQNDFVSLTIFAFDKDTQISTHQSKGDAMVSVIEGVGTFTVDGKSYCVKKGETLIMPANKPHSVYAKESFKMLLTVIFSNEK